MRERERERGREGESLVKKQGAEPEIKKVGWCGVEKEKLGYSSPLLHGLDNAAGKVRQASEGASCPRVSGYVCVYVY